MGDIVAFWSPYPGKARVTASMCAVMAQLGINYPGLDIAVSHTGCNDFSLEEKVDLRTESPDEKKELYKRTGVNALKAGYRQSVPNSEKIRRSAILLRMKSLFLYPNATGIEDGFSFFLLTELLKKEHDLVFLDVASGTEENTVRYLQASDLVVVVLPQEPVYTERFWRECAGLLEGKKFAVVIGGYMNTAKNGKQFIRKRISGKKKNCFCGVIPLNNGYFDAMTEGRALDYFYRNQGVRIREENYEFIVQTKKAAENIRKKLFT